MSDIHTQIIKLQADAKTVGARPAYLLLSKDKFEELEVLSMERRGMQSGPALTPGTTFLGMMIVQIPMAHNVMAVWPSTRKEQATQEAWMSNQVLRKALFAGLDRKD